LQVRHVSPFHAGVQEPLESMNAKVQNLLPVLLARFARLVLFQTGT